MALEVPQSAELIILSYLVNLIGTDGNAGPAGGDRLLRLFSSNTVPTEATQITDLTEVSGSTGYAPISLTGSNWTVAVVSGVSTAAYPEQLFTFTSAAVAYGYYITTTEVTPRLLWLERFPDGPYTITVGGQEIGVTPLITAD